jgi:hypothetical protein
MTGKKISKGGIAMKSRVMFLFLIGGILLFNMPLLAVDGYKDLKFGTTKSEILKKSGYNFIKTPVEQPGVEMYGCQNFTFGNRKVEAAAFFIDNKFLRFVIVAPLDQVQGIVSSLVEKYGPASSSSPEEAFPAVDNFPNREAFLAFDEDTVFFKITSDANREQTALLIYTSPLYDQHLLRLQKAGFKDDL